MLLEAQLCAARVIMDHLIQKRDDLLRGLVQLADEPALYKPSGGDNIEVRYHLNVGVRSVKRAYLLTYLLGGAIDHRMDITLEEALRQSRPTELSAQRQTARLASM